MVAFCSSTLHPIPIPYTLYPIPFTLHHIRCTLYPMPSTKYPIPCTQCPTPSTLNPQPIYNVFFSRRRQKGADETRSVSSPYELGEPTHGVGEKTPCLAVLPTHSPPPQPSSHPERKTSKLSFFQEGGGDAVAGEAGRGGAPVGGFEHQMAQAPSERRGKGGTWLLVKHAAVSVDEVVRV